MKILIALIKKEFLQIIRDPSSILIAFVLPLILLFIYMYAINLDSLKLNIGIKIEDDTYQLESLINSFSNNKYITSFIYDSRQKMYEDLVNTKLRALVIIPNNFLSDLQNSKKAKIQVITDGSEVNLANYGSIYANSVVQNWFYNSSNFRFNIPRPLIELQTRYWFNEKLDSHYFVLPGSLAITMTLIGMLLTALVIAREWERGTYEILITTNISKLQIVLSKYIPYFILGILSMIFNVFLCIFLFKIPFRGNFFVLLMFSSAFLFASLGIGLLISTIYKNQFNASQMVLVLGFMPSLMLSGLIYPIFSMPYILQQITRIIPARYFVEMIQSEFLSGTVWNIILPNSIFLFTLGLILFLIIYNKTKTRIE